MIHVVDTHAIVWHLEDSSQLSAAVRSIFADPVVVLVVPTIVLAEMRYLTSAGRTSVSWNDVLAGISADARFLMNDLDAETVLMMPTNLEIHDAIICATALLLAESTGDEVAVVTRDRAIRNSALVETVW